MNDKKILDYIDYLNIINTKSQIKQKLMYLSQREKTIRVSCEELAILFSIDYNNLNLNLFTIEEESKLTPIIMSFIRHEQTATTYSQEQLRKLLYMESTKRISAHLNKKIALAYAHVYNNAIRDEYLKINENFLAKICETIK